MSLNLKEFISSLIPAKQTNILWQLFNNTKSALEYLDTKLNILQRERNIMTATSNIALRNLAAQNGIEPVMKVESKGILMIKANQKLFNKNGYPLYITPYTKFRNKLNKVEYYYNGDTTLTLTNDLLLVPVAEGILEEKTYAAKGDLIENIYLKSDAIVEKSIKLSVGNKQFTEVKSFYNNVNDYDNLQFIVKYSISVEYPIILYVKGLNEGDVINISYRLCNGEYGNLSYQTEFEIDKIITSGGEQIEINDDDIQIRNYKGFNFGSNGTTTNALKSAIGYNHGSTLLFDNESYRNFLSKFSNILIQNIYVDNAKKSINHIYISKIINLESIPEYLIALEYNRIIDNKSYQFSKEELNDLEGIISENEYALSSHTLATASVEKYAVQLIFNNIYEQNKYSEELSRLIYFEFCKFLFDKHHRINFESLFQEFSQTNNITFEYTIFKESDKGKSKSKFIEHKDKLPILKGNFKIIDSDNNNFQLYENINITSK